jgi:23S rRNA (adenine2503-C2)-methyltransferase
MINDLLKLLDGEPAYRKKQVKEAVFKHLIANWDEAKTLPKILRDKLVERWPLDYPVQVFESSDQKTVKVLITFVDGAKIESVLMKSKTGRNTVCVSCQVGCPMKCAFCATGKMGFIRNLNDYEILYQILFFARYLKKIEERVTNVVFMGMGEPLLNYDEVMSAIYILNDPDCFGLAARRISVSTCGIVPGIKKLQDEKLQINLAISLHAPTDELRSKIMPVSKMYSLKQLFDAIEDYINQTGRKVMFEYIMLDGVNDSEVCALHLARLMKQHPLYMLNLIPYNQTGTFVGSKKETVMVFQSILEKQGVEVTLRHSFGRDIDAACGQLASKSN